MWKTEPTGQSDIRRIMREDRVVGLAMRYRNGLWKAHSPEDVTLSPLWFRSPAAVRKWFENNAVTPTKTPTGGEKSDARSQS